jgi:hypothetical protein
MHSCAVARARKYLRQIDAECRIFGAAKRLIASNKALNRLQQSLTIARIYQLGKPESSA